MKKTLIIGTCMIILVMSLASAWDDSNYDKRINVTINNIAGETLNDYPYFINLTHDDDMRSDCADLNIYETGETLSFEVDYCNTQNIGLWVKIPSLTTSGTTISVYYKNNTGINSLSNGATTFINYLTVHHMNNVNSTDSTGLANATSNLPAKTTLTNEIIGSAMDITPTAYLDLGNAKFDSNNITACAWVIIDSAFATDQRIITTGSENTNDWLLNVGANVFIFSNTASSHATKATTTLTTGRLYYLCGQNNVETLYSNGEIQSGTKTDSWSFATNAKIGARDASNHGLDGRVDEVTVYNKRLSSGWINQSYRNIMNQTTMVTLGAEEDLPGEEPPTIYELIMRFYQDYALMIRGNGEIRIK